MTQNPFQKAARAALSGKRLPGEDPDLDHIVARLSGTGRLVEAIAIVESLMVKAKLVHAAMIYVQAEEQIKDPTRTPAQAALWYLENVADDDPNRSDLFFAIKRRLSNG